MVQPPSETSSLCLIERPPGTDELLVVGEQTCAVLGERSDQGTT